MMGDKSSWKLRRSGNIERKNAWPYAAQIGVVGAACLLALLGARASHREVTAGQGTGQPRFTISFGSDLSATPLDGRVYAVISTNDSPEPRFQIREVEVESQQVFGADVNGLAPGEEAIIGEDALGYPAANFRDLPAGDYWVQGVLNKYTTFRRSDGHTVKLPMDEGEGQHWDSKPGNFYSVPERVHIDPATPGTIHIHLTKVIPPIEAAQDTEWVKHIRFQSEVLTKFWG